MQLQNEYLIIIDKETSSGFFHLCNSTNRLNELIESDGQLKIKNDQISTKKLSCSYFVKMGEVKGKNQNFFYLTINFDSDEKFIEEYTNLLRIIKSIFPKNETIIETLRDDLSFYYSQLAYSLIHNIENLMRKFITYFMITNVGKNWVNESSPDQIKEALDKSKRKQYMDVLQQLDFIHLGDFLFKDYQDKGISFLIEKIRTTNETHTISVSELKSFLPRSNWDKYFKEKVDCDDLYLKIRWEKLYELRNKIAHTSCFTKGDYEEIQNLVGEVKEQLEKAFINVDTIELREEEKELLSENIAVNVNKEVGHFLVLWQNLEKYLFHLAGNNKNNKNFLHTLSSIEKKKYFDKELIDQINSLRNVRNVLVHDIDTVKVDQVQIYNQILEKLNKALQMTWKNEIVEALQQLGGEATLEQIYDFIEKNSKKELSQSWKSSVRKTIYYYSSDADIFLGKEDLFQQTGKGKWKLKNIS